MDVSVAGSSQRLMIEVGNCTKIINARAVAPLCILADGSGVSSLARNGRLPLELKRRLFVPLQAVFTILWPAFLPSRVINACVFIVTMKEDGGK
jgi:hypothetical protein